MAHTCSYRQTKVLSAPRLLDINAMEWLTRVSGGTRPSSPPHCKASTEALEGPACGPPSSYCPFFRSSWPLVRSGRLPLGSGGAKFQSTGLRSCCVFL